MVASKIVVSRKDETSMSECIKCLYKKIHMWHDNGELNRNPITQPQDVTIIERKWSRTDEEDDSPTTDA